MGIKLLRRASLVLQLCFTLCAALALLLLQRLPAPCWGLAVGAQLLAVVLMPYAYWRALALGSVLAALPVVYEGADSLGWRWALLRLLPTMWPMMLLVYKGRAARWLPLARPAAWLLAVWPLLILMALTAAMALCWSAVIAIAVEVDWSSSVRPAVDLWGLLLGNYLGMLSVVPLGLSIASRLGHGGWRKVWRALLWRLDLGEMALTLGGTAALAGAMQCLFGFEPDFIWHSSGLLVVGTAALRYGWTATVWLMSLSILMASYGQVMAQASIHMQFEFAYAATLSFCLLVAAKTSRTQIHLRQDREGRERLLANGSALLFKMHLRFQQVCDWLKEDTQALCEAQQQLDEHWQRRLTAGQAVLDLQEQTQRAQHHLTELVKELSLPGQIDSETGLAEIFRRIGIVVVSGDFQALARRPYPVRTVWYRLLLEAGAYLASWPEGCTQLKLRLRASGLLQRRLLVQVSARWDSCDGADQQPLLYRQRVQRLLRFSCTGMQLEGLEYLVHIHRGQLRCRYLAGSVCLSLILPDEIF